MLCKIFQCGWKPVQIQRIKLGFNVHQFIGHCLILLDPCSFLAYKHWIKVKMYLNFNVVNVQEKATVSFVIINMNITNHWIHVCRIINKFARICYKCFKLNLGKNLDLAGIVQKCIAGSSSHYERLNENWI